MKRLVIPDSVKAQGVLWVAYPVIMRDWEWWDIGGFAELKLIQEMN